MFCLSKSVLKEGARLRLSSCVSSEIVLCGIQRSTDRSALRNFPITRLNPGNGCTALWVSPKGRGLSYAAIGGVFARHSGRRLGLHLCPHDARAAAATTWAVFSPEQIGVAQELLAHKDIRTTTTHYNRARGIEASRGYLQALKQIGER
jgi:integrase